MKNHLINKTSYVWPFLWLLLFTGQLSAQTLAAGPQVLSFHSEVDDTEQPYAIYLPKNYDPAKAYPFVVMLHGAGSNHRLALRRVFGKSNENSETDVETSRFFPQWKDRDYIVASTFARGTIGYQGIAEKDVLDMMEDVKQRFSVDENRTYLTGLSMGGGGTLWLGLAYPDKWAAIAPVCPAPPAAANILASNALNIPVHIFQGGADPVVKPEGTRQWVENLKKEGAKVEYKEFPGVQHDSWVNTYEGGRIFDWFDQFVRNPFPEHIKFVTAQYQHNKAYWLTVDAFTPGMAGKVDARFTDLNTVEIKTSNIQAFTLQLSKHPKFTLKKGLSLTIDGAPVKAKTQEGEVAFLKNGDKWMTNTGKPNDQLVKQSGLEGPMSEALAGRHVYVYGTGGNPSDEELKQRREQAEKAANWSFYRGEFLGRIMVFPRVLSDQQVRPSDLADANLVLFGDKNSNAVIAQFSDQLPLSLAGSAADYGLAYVFPVGQHYVLVNSGLSILDAPDSEKEIDGLTRFAAPAIVFALMKFDDYVVFDKEKVLANGFFDYHWELDEKAKAKLKGTGAVMVNH